MITFLQYALVGVVGFVSGVVTSWGYARVHGHRVVLPFISSTSRNFTFLTVGLALASLFTIVQVERSATQAEACQVEFRRALTYNTGIAQQDRELDDGERAAMAKARDALAGWFTAILSLPPGNRPEGIRITEEYRAADAQARQELDAIAHRRDELNASRAPYPEPTCGK